MLKQVRAVHPTETPPNCRCGQPFLKVVEHTDGRIAFFFCGKCDRPSFSK